MSGYPTIYAALRRLLAQLSQQAASAIRAGSRLTELLHSDDQWLSLQRGLVRQFGCAFDVATLRGLHDVRTLAKAVHAAEHGAAPAAADISFHLHHLHADEAAGQQPYQTVRVFYATDRARGLQRGPVQAYESRRGDGQLLLGVAEVAIPRSHRYGEIDSPPWWKFWASADPRKHITVLGAGELAPTAFWAGVRQCVGTSSEHDVLVLVHGYNVSFDQGLRRAAQIVRDLNFRGAPILYSWPSHGAIAQYAADEANVEWTVPRLRHLLRQLMLDAGAAHVHVIAHSMGNRAAVAAIRELEVNAMPPGAARLSQFVLAAPDIDADTFRQLAKDFAAKPQRCTLYANSQDRALSASDWIHGGYPRAGGGGDELVLVPHVDTIDATGQSTDFLSHSYFADTSPVINDLYYLIRAATPPDQRARLQREERAGLVYWRIAQ
jgi:esterase/lipase superfamily enzyme